MANGEKRIKEAPLKTCMIVQQLEDEFFKEWTKAELAALKKARKGDISGVVAVIGKRLEKAGIAALEVYGIIHDKDFREIWSETECRYILEQKPAHFHIVAKFMEGHSAVLKRIAEVLGLEPQYIEKAQKGKYAYDNMLAYLIHAKDADKFQYDVADVYSAGCVQDGKPLYRPYAEIYAERKAEWEAGRAKKKVQAANIGIDQLEEMILTGQVTRSEVVLTDRYYNVYAHNARRCNDAFAVYGEQRAYRTLQALERGEFKLTVFFITGAPGAGKTRLAKAFVQALVKASEGYDDRWQVCQTAATNPMDDYNGEEILFMDDVRGTSLSASDWLKLLDPHNISPASARYRNKVPACRVVVITSTKEPIEFFYYCKQMGGGDRSEALDQFLRRIQCLTRVIKADEFADTTVAISEGRKSAPYLTTISDASTERVELSYKFDNDRELSLDDAVGELVGMVEKNNAVMAEGSKDDGRGMGAGERGAARAGA